MFSNLGQDAVEIRVKSHNWVGMKTVKFHMTKEHLFFRTIFVLHLSGPNEQIYTRNEGSFAFNLGLITPLHTIVSPWFFTHF